MKNVHLIVFLLGLLFLASMGPYSINEEEANMARVNMLEGKYVFVMCEPVQEYEEVGRVNTALSALSGKDKDIPDLVKELVKKGIKKEEKDKMETFDAMITEDGAVGILIKFK